MVVLIFLYKQVYFKNELVIIKHKNLSIVCILIFKIKSNVNFGKTNYGSHSLKLF